MSKVSHAVARKHRRYDFANGAPEQLNVIRQNFLLALTLNLLFTYYKIRVFLHIWRKVIDMRLADLLEKIEYTVVQGSTDCDIAQVVYDSRRVTEGCEKLVFIGLSTV